MQINNSCQNNKLRKCITCDLYLDDDESDGNCTLCFQTNILLILMMIAAINFACSFN